MNASRLPHLSAGGWYVSDDDLAVFMGGVVEDIRRTITEGCDGIDWSIRMKCRSPYSGETVMAEVGIPVADAFDGGKSRRDVFVEIGREFVKSTRYLPTLVAHVAEGWAVAADKGQTREDFPDSLESVPGRREVVTVTCISFDGRKIGTVFEVSRNENGEMVIDGTMEFGIREFDDGTARIDDNLIGWLFLGIREGCEWLLKEMKG